MRGAPGPQAAPTLREWIRDHDEKWLFVLLYLGLAVGLSVFVSLFWLLVVAGLHFLLECVRQGHFWRSPGAVVAHALWEVKLDVGLLLLALTVALYLDVVMGILGLQSVGRAAAVSRAGARIGSRAAAWERNLRTFLLTFDEMIRIAQAALRLRGQAKRGAQPVAENAAGAGAEPAPGSTEPSESPSPPRTPAPDSHRALAAPHAPALLAAPVAAWRGRWGWGDRIGIALLVGGTLLLAASPVLTGHDAASALAALAEELRPFPGR